jgi:hypothetical protein
MRVSSGGWQWWSVQAGGAGGQTLRVGWWAEAVGAITDMGWANDGASRGARFNGREAGGGAERGGPAQSILGGVWRGAPSTGGGGRAGWAGGVVGGSSGAQAEDALVRRAVAARRVVAARRAAAVTSFNSFTK